MPRPAKLSTLDRHVALHLSKRGYSQDAIAASFGVTRTAISESNRKRGVTLRQGRVRGGKRASVSALAKFLARASVLRNAIRKPF